MAIVPKKSIDNLKVLMTPYFKKFHPITMDDKGIILEGNYFEWLYTYANLLRPKRYLEIGCYVGHSAVATCFGSQGDTQTFFLIDNGTYVPDCLEEAKANISSASNGNAQTHLFKLDTKTIDSLPQEVNNLDLIYIDGEHTYQALSHDIHLCIDRLNPSGHIVLDDCKISNELKQAAEDFLKRDKDFSATWVDSFTGHYIFHKITEEDCPLIKAWSQ